MSVMSRTRLAGVSLVVAPVMLLVVQLYAQVTWAAAPGYSWARNNISDLGNVGCGVWDGRHVCSPAHAVMNIALVLNGLLLATGVVLWLSHRPRRPSRAACLALIAGGLGWSLAGMFPADVHLGLHLTGAVLIFVVWPIAVTRVRPSTGEPAWLQPAGTGAAVMALTGFVLLSVGQHAGLGPGGMERVAAYPVEIWLLTVGLVLLAGKQTTGPAYPTL